jgi:hypothetical protein
MLGLTEKGKKGCIPDEKKVKSNIKRGLKLQGNCRRPCKKLAI